MTSFDRVRSGTRHGGNVFRWCIRISKGISFGMLLSLVMDQFDSGATEKSWQRMAQDDGERLQARQR